MGKRAVVLGGGGSRGPFQIGVWQALLELGLDYQIVTGSSVGAINGALMVQGEFELAKSMWENLTTEDVILESPKITTGNYQEMLVFLKESVERGGLDISPLENNIRRNVDEQKVRNSDVEYGLITSQYPFLRPVKLTKSEIPQGELVDYILASAAWFPFFQRKVIDGVQYIDGAYADNLPAELAISCGAEEIIAVDLQGMGIVHHYKSQVPITYIRSHWNLGSMVVFDTEIARRNMRLGHQEALKAFGKLEGEAYAFYPGSTRKNALQLRNSFDRIRRRTGVSLFRRYKRIPKIQQMLRYRNSGRFMRREPNSQTLGHAITCAAEIAGELLHIPPDEVYRLEHFNRLLREQAEEMHHPMGHQAGHSLFYTDDGPSHSTRRYNRLVLRRLYRMLLDGWETGKMSGNFWSLSTVSPVEFVAANYLLALYVSQS